MKRSDFHPLHEIRKFEYAQETISREGMDEINKLLWQWCKEQLPPDFDPQWVIVRGEYAGTFPKRVSAYLFKKFSVRLSKEQVSELGNVARMHSSKCATYYLDFTDRFNWHAGDFGDVGSCYWGCHAAARDMLANNDSLAVRLYKDSAGKQGYARAWIVFATTDDIVRDEHNRDVDRDSTIAIMYNAYGIESVRLARIVATMLGVSYRKINLECNGDTSGTLWINHNDPDGDNGGTHARASNGAGYALGAAEEIADIASVDLQWTETEYTCDSCGRELDENDICSVDNGSTLCSDCYNEIYTRCEWCDRDINRDNAILVDGEMTYCERCADLRATICYHCDGYFTEVTSVQGENYCAQCLERCFTLCDVCHEYVANYQITYLHDNHVDICNDCLTKEQTVVQAVAQ